jgi:hypothetical protein
MMFKAKFVMITETIIDPPPLLRTWCLRTSYPMYAIASQVTKQLVHNMPYARTNKQFSAIFYNFDTFHNIVRTKYIKGMANV